MRTHESPMPQRQGSLLHKTWIYHAVDEGEDGAGGAVSTRVVPFLKRGIHGSQPCLFSGTPS